MSTAVNVPPDHVGCAAVVMQMPVAASGFSKVPMRASTAMRIEITCCHSALLAGAVLLNWSTWPSLGA